MNFIFGRGGKLKKTDDTIGYSIEKSTLEYHINQFKTSVSRRDMIVGENYYDGEHDILRKTRRAIGNNGELIDIKNLPNNRLIDNQYFKMVSQKVNYLLGKPILFRSKNETYNEILKLMLNKSFGKTINNIGIDCLNGGIGWLYIHYNELGELSFTKFSPYELKPIWKDKEHTVLDYAIRVYYTTVMKNGIESEIEVVEVYTTSGVEHYRRIDGRLKAVEPFKTPYFTFNNESYNWSKIPLICFKFNNREKPLIKRVKSLQDGINTIMSNFQDNMQEDPRNTIMVLVNYGGENLGEFRQNLATYGAVKVQSEEGVVGDVKTINVEVNAENYKAILEIFKKALIENAMGYDAKDDRMSGNPNQMNIQSMYSDIDLDANIMELEYQASMEQLLWFINAHLYNTGVGDFENENVEVIFNRDMLMNEGDIITNIQNSAGILSKKTLIEQHPYVNDVKRELERLEDERKEDVDDYVNQFGNGGGGE